MRHAALRPDVDFGAQVRVLCGLYARTLRPLSAPPPAPSFSPDGLTWYTSDVQPYFNVVNYTAGGPPLAMSTRERPKLLFDADGNPTHVYNGICPTPHCPPQVRHWLRCLAAGVSQVTVPYPTTTTTTFLFSGRDSVQGSRAWPDGRVLGPDPRDPAVV